MLVSNSGRLKICDFGLSREFQTKDMCDERFLRWAPAHLAGAGANAAARPGGAAEGPPPWRRHSYSAGTRTRW